MTHSDAARKGRPRRALFVQPTDPAAYPPLIHASALMAHAGWEVTFLSAPITGMELALPKHPRIAVRAIPSRPSHVMGKGHYARYMATAAALGARLRPGVVYASDPLGAAPGMLAARLAGSRLVYHEHDSPGPGALRPSIGRLRAMAARGAGLVVFPNEQRARVAQAELGFAPDRLRIVWNLPRRAELPALRSIPEPPLIVYYHGSITPERLPETVVEAVRRYNGCVRLRIAGYEAPGAQGYVARLLQLGQISDSETFVEYVGTIHRNDLLAQAACGHVGIALMPPTTDDINMHAMTGASNKPFDYMAAGLALLVSDLPDWNKMFVAPGFARACNPADPDSIAAALACFIDHPEERRSMAMRARAKIESEWNYDTAFAPVLDELLAY